MRTRLLSATFATIAISQHGYSQSASVRHAIFDPILNRNGFYVNVPANWQFEGAMFPGSACEQNPMAVFRASSPDGLSGVYVLPRVDWSWSSGPKQLPAAAGCMPWSKVIPAHDYLTYLLPILNVGFVRETGLVTGHRRAEALDGRIECQIAPAYNILRRCGRVSRAL